MAVPSKKDTPAPTMAKDEATEWGPNQAPFKPPPSSLLWKVVPVIAIVFITGAVLGAYLASREIESEYRRMVTKLQTDHRAALVRTQGDYTTCQSRLSEEKLVCQEKVAKLRVQVDQMEREFQSTVEHYLSETNTAYRAANEGLDRASSRLKEEVEGHESTRLQLSQADKRVAAMRNTMHQSNEALKASKDELRESEQQVQRLQQELDDVEEEFDRRDLERAECDAKHRSMIECLEELDVAKKLTFTDEEMTARLDMVIGQRDNLLHKVELLTEGQKSAEYWEKRARLMMERVTFRSQKEVLKRFGAGPHHVELTLSFDSSPDTASILLELAPLDSMPHTIHTFLDIVERKLLSRGTFILARDHILVGGPNDAYDGENNAVLRERIMEEGYLPNGALLFGEYSPDFPHVPLTFAFSHLGGPSFYINLRDNSELHGPGFTEEGQKEGDPCFAKIVEGQDVVQRVLDIPKVADSFELPVYIVDSQVVTDKY